jgi:hypothetical protein
LDAAGSGVIDAVGSVPEADGVPEADWVPEADGVPGAVPDAGALADAVADDPAALVELLDPEEQPAMATATPAAAASAARDGRNPRTMTDDTELPTDTGLPNPGSESRQLTRYPPGPGTRCRWVTASGIMSRRTPAFTTRRVGQRKGK